MMLNFFSPFLGLPLKYVECVSLPNTSRIVSSSEGFYVSYRSTLAATYFNMSNWLENVVRFMYIKI
jgi:hypothetical protein